MIRTRVAPLCLTICSVILLAALLSGGVVAGRVFASLAVAFAPLLVLLVVRERRLVGVLILLIVILESATWCVMLGDGQPGDWLGLPFSAVAMLLGLWALPLIVAVGGYLWSFDRWAGRS